MRDLTKLPFLGKLSPEEQELFEKKSKVDDINEPPVIKDENGNYNYDDEQID